MNSISSRRACECAALFLVLLIAAGPSSGGPWLNAGERTLRTDIQLLVDGGVLSTPVLMWPIPAAELARAVSADIDIEMLSPAEAAALGRLRVRLRHESSVGEVNVGFSIAGSENSTPRRNFSDTPREDGEINASAEWIGQNLALGVSLTGVINASDDKDFRFDNSHIDGLLGNWILSGNVLDRWWGPGWDSSLILSSNARPVPALTLERNYADAPDVPGLRWVGPWRAALIWGFQEDGREIPNSRLFGLRFDIRPLPGLEIGFSRTAQWCGDGRPCDFDTFIKLLIGDDNSGDDDTLTSDREPGNQLAGFDLRWSTQAIGFPGAVYAQAIGEDEAGGLPSRYLGMLGFEAWITPSAGQHYWHAYAEFSDTACDFVKSEPKFNCGYNNGIYTDGYRYRGRAIGHGIDNDSRSYSVGVDLVDSVGNNWSALVRAVELNRGGTPDNANTTTPTPQDLLNIELFHTRNAGPVSIEAGVGLDLIDDEVSGDSAEDVRVFFRISSGLAN